jgi:hypothetical protein
MPPEYRSSQINTPDFSFFHLLGGISKLIATGGSTKTRKPMPEKSAYLLPVTGENDFSDGKSRFLT